MKRWNMLAALAVLGAVAACDNPVDSERHTGPASIVIEAAGVPVVNGASNALTGAITVAAGGTTPALAVRFLDLNHQAVTTSGYWLKVTSANADVAEWVPTSEGAFTGVIRGRAAGSTTLRFEYYHGSVGRGHADGDAFDVGVVTGG